MTTLIPNPETLCGVPTTCCPAPIPEKLVATIANVDKCGCADGSEITLTHDPNDSRGPSGAWKGTGDFGSCGRQISITFYCPVLAIWHMDISFSDNCSGSQTAIQATGHQCQPLSMVFDPDPFHEQCCAQPGNMTSTISITVTQ
jgi:hypothetical protein